VKAAFSRLLFDFRQFMGPTSLSPLLGFRLGLVSGWTYCAAAPDLLRQLALLCRFFVPKYSLNPFSIPHLRFIWFAPSLPDLLPNP
jgi:hypothetical protein